MMEWDHFQILVDKIKHEPHIIYYPSAKQTIHLIATLLNSDQHLELLELLYQQLFLTFSANEINVENVLNVSVACNNTTFYKFIQSKGHCINDKEEALIMAASKSNLDLLQLIIKNPPKIKNSVETWQNVLIKALENNNHEMVEFIMKYLTLGMIPHNPFYKHCLMSNLKCVKAIERAFPTYFHVSQTDFLKLV
ncbi:hypothetical protein CYY_007072, partial [Polysphondylium violaceum]